MTTTVETTLTGYEYQLKWEAISLEPASRVTLYQLTLLGGYAAEGLAPLTTAYVAPTEDERVYLDAEAHMLREYGITYADLQLQGVDG